MNNTFSIDSIYTVSNQTQLHSFDRKVISALYQPIIGHCATSLYFTLWSEVEVDKVYTSPSYVKRLSKIMSMDLQTIIDSFNYLEALGLVKSFCKIVEKTSYYQLFIYSPEPPTTFFKNPLLVNSLKSALGNDDYIKTKMFFQMIDKPIDDYENVTKKYKDVFSLNHDPKIVNNTESYKSYNYAKIDGEIDFDFIKDALKPFKLHHIILESKVRDTLEMIMLSYDITTHDLVSAIVESCEENTIDLNELVKNIELKIKIREYKTTLDLVYLKNKDASNKYEKNSVFEFLKKYYKSLKIDNDLLIKLENCMKEYQLNTGVINVLIELVVKRTNVLNINYLKVIAKQWQQEKVVNVTMALEKVKSINNKSSVKTKYNKKTIGNADEWYQVNDESSKELSEEERQRIDDILSKL